MENCFCGDGGDPGQVARAQDGQWIYLFRPELIKNQGIDDKSFVQPGVLRSEKPGEHGEASVSARTECQFQPRPKWVVFRSNMFGPTYVFAVEVEKANAETPSAAR